ncbi:AraC-like DNA-binding protein [Neorhizobium sp. JUb45]|nr:AraC-like DNA-binding protein [Neorhizobium sp. JUb45]
MRADLVKRTGLARQETLLAPMHHAVMINLKGEARTGEDFVDGQRVSFTPRRPGSIVFVPALSEWRGWDEGDRTGSYLLVTIHRTFIAKSFEIDDLPDLKPVIGLRDPMIEASLKLVADELANPDPISTMMVESQAIQMIIHLVRLQLLGFDTTKGGLSGFDLRRVVATIDGRLADPPSLSELAGEVGLSRRQFFRAFKQSTGKTPHTYVLDQRLDRAADLLRTSTLSATDIAFESGFGSSSHFTATFKKAFGSSPLEFRRTWRR